MTSPPAICGDVVIVGSSIHDGEITPPSPPGDVRGYDARTGQRRWTFHTIPRAGEAGVETWDDGSWRENGGANVWAPMSVDREHGRVYLPVSAPTNNYYGGRRPGDNLYGNSLVALDCATGRRLWHFQTVHHDIWDYDLPAAPNLVDLRVDGREVEAVAQITKQGFVFVFDRATGEPIWPIDEVAVPESAVPGERAATTQPVPSRPPPFERQGVALDQLVDATPAVHAAALEIVSRYDWGDLFEPPSLRGTIVNPGIGGGGNWGGASFDPETERSTSRRSGVCRSWCDSSRAARPTCGSRARRSSTARPATSICSSRPTPPSPPTISTRGEIRWQVPNSGPAGVVGHASSLVTETLLFYETRSHAKLAAFDKASGERLWEIALPANASGAPMTYMAGGRQHVVVAVGSGDQQTMELVAFRLPRSAVGSPGAVRFAGASASAKEKDGAARLTVTRQGGREGAVTVEVAPVAGPTGGTATAGLDFDAAARRRRMERRRGRRQGSRDTDSRRRRRGRRRDGGVRAAQPDRRARAGGAVHGAAHHRRRRRRSLRGRRAHAVRSRRALPRARRLPDRAARRARASDRALRRRRLLHVLRGRTTSRCWSRCTTPAQHPSNDSGSSPPASPTSR